MLKFTNLSKRFFSTFKPKLLSPAQLKDYDKNGYLVLTDMLTKSEKEKLLKWTDEIQSYPDEIGKWMSYYETEKATGKKILSRRENFLQYIPEFNSLVTGKLNQLCSDIFNEPSVIYKEKVNFKLPGGNGFTAHQDAPAFLTYGVKYHITLMLPVDKSTKDNGALEIVKGMHKEGILPQTPKLTIDPLTEKKLNFELIEADLGDIILFGSYTPHRSGPNFSSMSRRVHYITYNKLSDGAYRERYFAEKRKYFPPENEREPGKDYEEGKKVFNLGNPID